MIQLIAMPLKYPIEFIIILHKKNTSIDFKWIFKMKFVQVKFKINQSRY